MVVKQHTKTWTGGDFTISTRSEEDSSVLETLFTVDGEVASFSQRRHVRDASGLPIFEIRRKRAGVTWFVHLPGDSDSEDAKPLATIAPRLHPLKDKFDVHFKNASANGEDTVLEVRGQDIWKYRTNVYHNGTLVMVAKLTDMVSVYLPIKRPKWDLEVAEGFDLSLASTIGIILAALLYQSMMHSRSAPSPGGNDPGEGSSGKQ
ncbi:hypothetical protein P170DRAFT_436481 [Aspergillus steynii IBT 23096]|uniref:Tubby C-terminal-like domain-containing protein n=1 Tax=Aspergillus steynii IBT 23096 TaxID=1392250 RepID=A0A2I2G795_9EURO|nr:uncharacterized protein P170DRAFT_436481 [Aspergillus steynii IBT 23096]PLB48742.1 hypothetical protein P170DRAFT_436481 [Aspergillus steynii IBT 23096]